MSTLVKTVNGTAIYLTESGTFEAVINNQRVTAGSLATLEKKLGKPKVALKVTVENYGVFRERILVEPKKRQSKYTATEYIDDKGREVHGDVYLTNPAVLAALEEADNRRRKAEDEWRSLRDALAVEREAIISQLTKVTKENFYELAAKQAAEEAAAFPAVRGAAMVRHLVEENGIDPSEVAGMSPEQLAVRFNLPADIFRETAGQA